MSESMDSLLWRRVRAHQRGLLSFLSPALVQAPRVVFGVALLRREAWQPGCKGKRAGQRS